MEGTRDRPKGGSGEEAVYAHRAGPEGLTGAKGAVLWDSRRAGYFTACNNPMHQPAQRATTSAEQVPQPAPGPSRALFLCTAQAPERAPGGRQLPGNSYLGVRRGRGVRPRMHAAGPAWSPRATAG